MNNFRKGKTKKANPSNEPRKLYGHFKRLQDIYDRGEIRSNEFYNQTVAYIKRLLNKYLYQKQFSEDNINDCFVSIYERIESHYKPDKGCLGTFIHTIIRNYCSKVNYKLVNHQTPISLDFEYINKEDLNTNYDGNTYELEEDDSDSSDLELDNVENYCESLKMEDTLDIIEYCFDLKKQYDSLTELTTKDINKINTLDAVRKDLLWNVWIQSRQA